MSETTFFTEKELDVYEKLDGFCKQRALTTEDKDELYHIETYVQEHKDTISIYFQQMVKMRLKNIYDGEWGFWNVK